MRKRRYVVAAIAVIVASCSQRDATPRPDGTVARDTGEPHRAAQEGGSPRIVDPSPFIAVALDSQDSAQLLWRNGAADARVGEPIDLFDRAGSAGHASIGAASDTAAPGATACAIRAITAIAPAHWHVALRADVADAIPLDSLERHSGRDSLRLVVIVTRLAVRVPADTVDAMRGLPYTIRGVWQFALDSGHVALAAIASRSLGLEADPRGEQLLLFAERDRDSTEWTTRLSERRTGAESELATDDVLAVVRMRSTGNVVVFVERVGNAAHRLALFARTGRGAWSHAWESEPTDCAR